MTNEARTSQSSSFLWKLTFDSSNARKINLMAERKRRGRKEVTDLTGRDDVTTEEIIRGLTPAKPKNVKIKIESKWDRAKRETEKKK